MNEEASEGALLGVHIAEGAGGLAITNGGVCAHLCGDRHCCFGGGASGASAVAVRLDPRGAGGGGASTDQVFSAVLLALAANIDEEDGAVGAVALLDAPKKRIPAANIVNIDDGG